MPQTHLTNAENLVPIRFRDSRGRSFTAGAGCMRVFPSIPQTVVKNPTRCCSTVMLLMRRSSRSKERGQRVNFSNTTEQRKITLEPPMSGAFRWREASFNGRRK